MALKNNNPIEQIESRLRWRWAIIGIFALLILANIRGAVEHNADQQAADLAAAKAEYLATTPEAQANPETAEFFWDLGVKMQSARDSKEREVIFEAGMAEAKQRAIDADPEFYKEHPKLFEFSWNLTQKAAEKKWAKENTQ